MLGVVNLPHQIHLWNQPLDESVRLVRRNLRPFVTPYNHLLLIPMASVFGGLNVSFFRQSQMNTRLVVACSEMLAPAISDSKRMAEKEAGRLLVAIVKKVMKEATYTTYGVYSFEGYVRFFTHPGRCASRSPLLSSLASIC